MRARIPVNAAPAIGYLLFVISNLWPLIRQRTDSPRHGESGHWRTWRTSDVLSSRRLTSVHQLLTTEIVRCFVVINCRDKRHIQYARTVIVRENNDEPATRIQKCMVASRNIDDSPISRAQSERLTRFDRFTNRCRSHRYKVYDVE